MPLGTLLYYALVGWGEKGRKTSGDSVTAGQPSFRRHRPRMTSQCFFFHISFFSIERESLFIPRLQYPIYQTLITKPIFLLAQLRFFLPYDFFLRPLYFFPRLPSFPCSMIFFLFYEFHISIYIFAQSPRRARFCSL